MNFVSLLKQKAQDISNKLASKPTCVKITDRLFHCNYPESTQVFSTLMKQCEGNTLQMWNLSEYPYPPEIKKAIENLGGELH